MALYIARRILWMIDRRLLRDRDQLRRLLPPALRGSGCALRRQEPDPAAASQRSACGSASTTRGTRSSASSPGTSSPATSTAGPASATPTTTAARSRRSIFARAPRTLFLVAGAAILWLVGGVAIGVLSAVKRRTLIDRGAMGFALFGISTPVFWLGLMALYIVWSKLGLTGGTGYVSPVQSISGFFSHMILPWCVLALALRRVLRADDAQHTARDARRGLHPHRARQGPLRAHR